jgi:hypothetical protein
MDPLRMCLAWGPVAVYLLLIGAVNLSRRPFLVSGARDTAALGLAVSGLVVVGPVELFFPVAASIGFGALVWGFLIALYAFCLVLVMLVARPRLVVYNVSSDEFRPILAELAMRLDAEARWAGDSLVLPQLGVQLYLESMALLRNVSLRSAGPNQNPQGWWQLESALGGVLASLEVPRNACGVVMAVLGAILSAVLLGIIAYDPQTVNRLLFEMLNV